MPSFTDIYLYLHKLIKYTLKWYDDDRCWLCEIYANPSMDMEYLMISIIKQNIIISNSHTSFACKNFFLIQKKKKIYSWVWNMYVSRLDLAFNNFILYSHKATIIKNDGKKKSFARCICFWNTGVWLWYGGNAAIYTWNHHELSLFNMTGTIYLNAWNQSNCILGLQ